MTERKPAGMSPESWAEEQLDLPPSLQLRQDRNDFLETLESFPDEAAVRRVAEHLNGRIRYANSHGITGPTVTLMPMDVDELAARWQRANAD